MAEHDKNTHAPSLFINKDLAVRSSLVDLLRVLAISLIVAAHSGQVLDLWWGETYAKGFYNISLGTLGVTIFVVISGTVLRLNDRGQGVMTFYARRLQRIYPVYWMALALGLVMGFVFHWDNFPKDWVEGALTLTGFCAFAGLWGCGFGPAWFVGLILSLYVCYPWLSRLMNRTPGGGTLLALLLLSLAARLTVEDYLPHWPREWFPLCRVFEFGLGIYLAQEGQLMPAFRWKAPAPISRILEILSELSFPVFLIHWLFRPVYWHLGPPLHVLVFLLMTLSVSYVVLAADSFLQETLFRTTRSAGSPVVLKLSVARQAWNSFLMRALPSNPQQLIPKTQETETLSHRHDKRLE